MKNTWNAFFSARPQSSFTRKDAPKQSQSQKKFARPNVRFKKLPFIDVCSNWNKGTCNKQPGTCFSSRGSRFVTYATTARIQQTWRPTAVRTTRGWWRTHSNNRKVPAHVTTFYEPIKNKKQWFFYPSSASLKSHTAVIIENSLFANDCSYNQS